MYLCVWIVIDCVLLYGLFLSFRCGVFFLMCVLCVYMCLKCVCVSFVMCCDLSYDVFVFVMCVVPVCVCLFVGSVCVMCIRCDLLCAIV